MQPKELVNDGDGLHPTGLVLESFGELVTAAEAVEFAATHPDTFDLLGPGVYEQLAIALRARVNKFAASDNSVVFEAGEQLGAGLILVALDLAAESHPNETTQLAARAVLDLYQTSTLNMQVADQSVPPDVK